MAAPRSGGWRTTYGLPFVIGASSAGTIIEWYDFYLYATLTPFLAPLFFPSDNPTAQLLSAFAAYAAGFLVRPFGAVVFGRIGDVIGRKYAFLLTISIMGGATVIVGLLPTHAQIGFLAPVILVLLRLAQGLALGGEYGGAAIYVAEHAPDNKRGFYTSWIQTTATVGFFLALAIILLFRTNMSAADFANTGWRFPFLISAILLAIAIYIRMRLQETPLFARLKARGETTKNTATWAKDSFSGRKIGTIALVLLGLTAGQGVVWYQGQFQANFFMITYLHVPFTDSYKIMLWAVALGTPFFLFFGWLSDKIGRKVIILSGCLIAALAYWPIYHMMYDAAHVTTDGTGLITGSKPDLVALVALVWIQVIFVTMVYGPIAAFLVEYFRAKVRYTSLSIPYHFGNGWFGGLLPLFFTALVGATFPVGSKSYVPFLSNFMGLPIKTSWDLRGFNPANDPNGNIYLGLSYVIIVALMSVVVGTLFLHEPKGVKIWSEVGGEEEPGLVTEATPAD
ncbi:MAG TPA: MFS transporter [Candidatus Limnocylindria bacterium]|nr:MFS transporter [Candidatus Limnocylindria bacterium]